MVNIHFTAASATLLGFNVSGRFHTFRLEGTGRKTSISIYVAMFPPSEAIPWGTHKFSAVPSNLAASVQSLLTAPNADRSIIRIIKVYFNRTNYGVFNYQTVGRLFPITPSHFVMH